MMNFKDYQIRQCERAACGLRFPTVAGNTVTYKCPVCHASTKLIMTHHMINGPEKRPIPQPITRIEGLLDNIRSAWNVGSIFRTSDGAGIRHLYLCGITPTPENPRVLKTSLGSEITVGWSRHLNGVIAVETLKSLGYRLWALEDSPHAVSLNEVRIKKPGDPIVLVVGNEVCGVDPEILENCEQVIYLSMSGRKQSYNAAVAFGIAAFHLRYYGTDVESSS
jgi:23S rRNA (guanosine2251-2'-O)-methyltransferase